MVGLVGWAHFVDRMNVLTCITDSRDPVNIGAARLLQVEGLQDSDPWLDEAEDIESGGVVTVVCSHSEIDDSADENEVILLVLGIHRLRHWHFHQFDDDFFPSVPHGHWEGKARPKFDPYLGWVYEGSRQVRRERRSLVVELWNDETFRQFAGKAIDYYLAEHPHFTGWRVRNPRRLPRKR